MAKRDAYARSVYPVETGRLPDEIKGNGSTLKGGKSVKIVLLSSDNKSAVRGG